MEELNKNIEKLKNIASFYENEIELRIMDNCPFIVEVGALTVGTDETGKVIAQNAIHPIQFTQKAVDEIMVINWENENGEKVFPIVFSRNSWYRHKLKMVNETLELLEDSMQGTVK
ncbi:MAG: hypothetical protein WCP32_08425 [Bacteroidota bacterium]